MYIALRTLAAILVGMFAAFVLVVAVELFSAVVHPLPGVRSRGEYVFRVR